MKKFSLMLTFVLSLTFVTPKAQAAVGLVTGNAALTCAGLVLSAVGGTVGFIGSDGVGDSAASTGMLGLLLGLLILDSEGEQMVEFSQLSKGAAKKLQISEEERSTYNLEIDQANAMAGEVSNYLSTIEKPTQRDSHKMWQELRTLVSESTYEVMQKIVSQK